MYFSLPVISFKAIRNNDDFALNSVRKACETTGMFRLTEHGLERQSKNFLKNMKAYFSQPLEQKKLLERNEKNPWGYFDSELTKNKRDWKEIFDLVATSSNDVFESEMRWPETPKLFKEINLDWHKKNRDIAITLLGKISLILGGPEEELTKFFTKEDTSFLRLNHYPVCNHPAKSHRDSTGDGHLGIYDHTDAGALTILAQSETPGLQIREGSHWKTVPSVEKELIVNTGDLLQIWSNDQFPAPVHRVLANDKFDRYSAAFFLNPKYETDVVPLSTTNQKFHSLNWGDFRSKRSAGDYADLGEEIQIDHFRV